MNPRKVTVWWSRIREMALEHRTLASHLSAEERARAKRFRRDSDRNRYLLVHGILRKVLALHTGKDPEHLRLETRRNGKPVLASGTHEVSFSLSYDDSLLAIAVARGDPVGIDIERVRSIPEIEQIADRFLSAREQAVLARLNGTERLEAFFRCWTRKEAFVKATGRGLDDALPAFSVTVLPGEQPEFLEMESQLGQIGEWSLAHFEPVSGWVGAVAVRTPLFEMDIREGPSSD